MRGLTLTHKEQVRLQVLNRVVGREITPREAATILGLSERQTRRLLAAYREEGAAALAHGNRGRRAANAIPDVTRQAVVTLARTVYARFNHTHITDLLAEREGLVMARSTVRSILLGAGITSPRRRRAPRHRSRRQRKPQEGMLLQLDGSIHAWLEERGPKLSLLLAVDDATGTVPAALFRPTEDARGYLSLFQTIVQRCGIPLAVYTDRHAVFRPLRRPAEGSIGASTGGRSQFGRAMKELGVQHILALSPEAKGRVERAYGTFQDRLVAELRLADARTLHEANHVLQGFLGRFNTRFGVPAAQVGSAYRSVPPGLDLAGVLCFKESRKVARDNTVTYKRHALQLLPTEDCSSYAGALVEVQERLNGTLAVSFHRRLVPIQEAPASATRLRTDAPPVNGSRAIPENLLLLPETPGSVPRTSVYAPWDDYAYRSFHRELVRVGMERARQQGKHIGRPRVTQREGFRLQWEAIVLRIHSGELSRRRAAQELGIGYATLHRLLQAEPRPGLGHHEGTPSPGATLESDGVS